VKILRYGMKFVCNLQCEYFFFCESPEMRRNCSRCMLWMQIESMFWYISIYMC